MRTVGYNAFYGNSVDFTGYGPTYGQVILANRNGTPCDLLYNVFENPLFVAANDLHLQTNSPCANASAPGQAFENMCEPPSIGTAYGDMGAYGGPDACNWLDLAVAWAAPVLQPVGLTNGTLSLTWSTETGATYQLQCNSDLSSTNWTNLGSAVTAAGATLSATDPVTNGPPRFYRVVLLP